MTFLELQVGLGHEQVRFAGRLLDELVQPPLHFGRRPALRHRLPRLPFWGLVLFLLPMALDGTTHLISDFAGLGQGFRDSNLWLAMLTHNTLRATFYAGDAWGSFNSIMRLLTGIFFGMGIVWFGFPYIEDALGLATAFNS